MPLQLDPATLAVSSARLPFAEQVEFFRQKLNLGTARWTDIMREQHDRSFVVAGAMADELVADFRSAVDSAIAEGTTIQTFRREFDAIVAKHGWSYVGARDWRTRVIYRTNLSTSYAAGRLAQMKDSGLPYWMYKHSDSVLYPRPLHVSWDGLTLPAGDPWWSTHYPPNGWNCFPAGTPVRCEARLGLKTWYAGEMVEIATARGARLTVTAHHPVLTLRGWVAACRLQESDELLGATGKIDAPVPGVVDHQQPPARAEDLFEALAAQALRVVPMAPDDFHGDAHLRESEIHVAGADGALVDIIEAALRQFRGEGGLQRALHGRVEATDDPMRTAQVAPVERDAVLAEDAADGGLGDAQPARDLRLAREPGTVQREHLALDLVVPGVGDPPGGAELPFGPAGRALDRLPAQSLSFRFPAQVESREGEGTAQRAAAAPALFRQLEEAGTGAVARDQVVEIRKFEWSGHVYDFVTGTGLILAAGLVVSNCQCRVVAVSRETAEALGGRIQPPPDDGTDPKTGAPRGIDKGWDYQPGASVVDDLRRAAGA